MEQYDVSLKDYLRIVFKRKWILLQTVLIITLGAFLYSYLQVPIYFTRGSFLVKEKKGIKEEVLNEIFKVGSSVDIGTYIQLLKSKKYMQKVADYLNKNYKTNLTYRTLRNMYNIYNQKDTKLIIVEAKGTNPQLITDAVNKLIEFFTEGMKKEENKSLLNTKKFLEDRLQEVSKQLAEYEKMYREFKSKNKSFVLSDTVASDINRYAAFKSQLEQLKIDIESLERKIKIYRQKTGGMGVLKEKKVYVERNPLIAKLKESLFAAQIEKTNLSVKYGPKHPKIQELNSKIKLLKEKLKELTNKLLNDKEVSDYLSPAEQKVIEELLAMEAEYKAMKVKEEILKKELQKKESIFSRLPKEEIEYANIVRNKKIIEEINFMLKKRISEIEILLAGYESKLEIVDNAQVPTVPISPKVLNNVLLSFFLSLVLGLTLVFVAEYFGRRIENPEDAEKILGVPTLGIIPQIKTSTDAAGKNIRGQQIITVWNKKSKESEAYRMLRTNIQFLNPDKPVKSILITSSLPKEGKSVTLANLAVAFAQINKKVLVVDTDMRRPVQHKIFGCDNTEGLSNMLIKDMDFSKYIKQTQVDNLFLLPTGPIPPNPAEFLNSHRMEEIMEELEQHFDYIFYDSPPVVMVTDAAILATRVDGVLYIMTLGEIPDELLLTCKRNLENVNAKLLGIVINRLDLTSSYYSKYYNNYYYYSYYNYYYPEE